MAKILKESYMRKLEAQLAKEEITYSRMLELIEEKVLEGHILKTVALEAIEEMHNAAFYDETATTYFKMVEWISKQ